jgi:hypothetical protein
VIYEIQSNLTLIRDPTNETNAEIKKKIKLNATAAASSIPTSVCEYTKTNSRAPTHPMVRGKTATIEESKNTSW